MSQFLRDLALIPIMWRYLVRAARRDIEVIERLRAEGRWPL